MKLCRLCSQFHTFDRTNGYVFGLFILYTFLFMFILIFLFLFPSALYLLPQLQSWLKKTTRWGRSRKYVGFWVSLLINHWLYGFWQSCHRLRNLIHFLVWWRVNVLSNKLFNGISVTLSNFFLSAGNDGLGISFTGMKKKKKKLA